MEKVLIRIRGSQANAETGDDSMEFATEAQLYRKNGAVYLIYEESELSGIPGCRTRLKIKDDKVHMKRFGKGAGAGSEMIFEKGKRYSGFYETPYGTLEMEVLTDRLENGLSENGCGYIDIDYSISLKGLLEARNRLNITVMQNGGGIS